MTRDPWPSYATALTALYACVQAHGGQRVTVNRFLAWGRSQPGGCPLWVLVKPEGRDPACTLPVWRTLLHLVGATVPLPANKARHRGQWARPTRWTVDVAIREFETNHLTTVGFLEILKRRCRLPAPEAVCLVNATRATMDLPPMGEW